MNKREELSVKVLGTLLTAPVAAAIAIPYATLSAFWCGYWYQKVFAEMARAYGWRPVTVTEAAVAILVIRAATSEMSKRHDIDWSGFIQSWLAPVVLYLATLFILWCGR